MNLLVTGGAGFIGSNFIMYMLNKYETIKIINLDKLTYAGNLENLKSVEDNVNYTFQQGDICDSKLVQKIFKESRIDCVINFAAESHVDRSIVDSEIFVKTNVLGTVNLLNCAKAAWQTVNGEYRECVKFLQVSTDEVYGSLDTTGSFSETTPLDPHSPYSSSKAAADHFVKAYWDTYNFPINITRCSNNYGPYQFPEKLIPLMINNALQSKSLPVYGDGMQIRDWLHVYDHCSAIDIVMRKGKLGEIYNIGGNNEKANIDIVKLIIRALGKNENLISHVKDRLGHDRRYAIDNTKIKTQLSWEPEITFEKGIYQTIEWYLNNSKWLKKIISGNYMSYYEEMYLKNGQQ